MADFDQTLPPVLAEANQLDYDYDDGNGFDFESYSEFQSADENASWIRAWTGNKELDGAEYRIFGQDGTGGLAMFWLTRAGAPLVEQPIVFFGSEGEVGMVAKNLADYLWLLAGGIGAREAVESPGEGKANAAFTALAQRHAASAKKTAAEVMAAARAEFPDFEAKIRAACKHG